MTKMTLFLRRVVHKLGLCHKQRIGYPYCRALNNTEECGPFFGDN